MWPFPKKSEPAPVQINITDDDVGQLMVMLSEWRNTKMQDADAMMKRAHQELHRDLPDPRATQLYRYKAIRDRLVEQRPFLPSDLQHGIDQKITELERAIEGLR